MPKQVVQVGTIIETGLFLKTQAAMLRIRREMEERAIRSANVKEVALRCLLSNTQGGVESR